MTMWSKKERKNREKSTRKRDLMRVATKKGRSGREGGRNRDQKRTKGENEREEENKNLTELGSRKTAETWVFVAQKFKMPQLISKRVLNYLLTINFLRIS